MPAAALFIGFIAVETGVAVAIGSALASSIGLSVAAAGVTASLAAGTISAAAAIAIGSGAISAGISLAQGASISDALKGAVISGIASFAGASIAGDVTSSITDAATKAGMGSIASNIGKVAGAMASGSVSSGIGAALSGKDPIDALIKGGLTAGLTSGVMQGVSAVTSKIPGFNDLAKDYGAAGAATQRAINSGLAAGVLGKNTDAAVVRSVLNSVLSESKDYFKEGIKDLSSTLKNAYTNVTTTGETLESNISSQKEIVADYQSTAAGIEAQRVELQGNLDKYNEAKNNYDNYETNALKNGFVQNPEDGGWAKPIYNGIVNVPAGYDENGYHEAYSYKAEPYYVAAHIDPESLQSIEGRYVNVITGQEVAPTKDSFIDEANKYAALVNDAIPGFNEAKTAAEEKIAGLTTELDTLQTQVPTLQEKLVTEKLALDASLANFQNQEEANAQLVLTKFNDALAANTTTNTTTVTNSITDTTAADAQTAADADAQQVTTAEAKAQFIDTYGYTPTDAELNQFVGQRNQASTYTDIGTYVDPLATTDKEAIDIYKQQYADMYGIDAADVSNDTISKFMADTGNTAETDYTGGVQNQLSKDLGFDDYADRTYAAESLGEQRPDADIWKDFQTTSGVVGMEGSEIMPTQFAETDQAANFLPEVPTPPKIDTASANQTNEQTADQIATEPDFTQTLAGMINQGQERPTDYGMDTQVAAFTPRAPDIMSDMDDPLQSIGLRGTSAPKQPDIAPSRGIASLLSDENKLTKPDLTATTQGTATNSALTGQDATKTIGTSILDDKPDDIHGGVQTSGLYSGAENEIGASDTLTAKYLNKPTDETKAVKDVGLTPTTQAPTRGALTNLESNMDDDYSGTEIDPTEALLTPNNVDESFLDRLSPADRERYLATQEENYVNPYASLQPQDLGISQENMDSFNKNFNPDGGFSSGWQTVGIDRILINDDGTGSGINENGDPYDLSPEEVQQMIKQGLLNTKSSGYVAATGGTRGLPGGSGGTKPGTGGTKSFGDKLLDKLLTPKAGAILAGATLGALSKPKGVDPRGLRSLGAGSGAQRVQTGAKGTGGKGSVRYFEKKAGGGAINGYAHGGGLGYLKSAHDGMEDKIDATIDNKRPAKLSGGEFVIPADVVSHLGNGNSEAGAKQLYALMERVRKARTGTAEQGKQINPKKYLA